MRKGAPEDAWRTTKTSACIAERFATVSSSDSPLLCDETAMLRLMTSADSRLAAISKVVRVRVEGSKNRLKTLLPRRSGTFFTSRSVTPTKDSAVSRICSTISRGNPSIDSRCCSSPCSLSWGLRCTLRLQRQRELAVGTALEAQPHARRDIDLCAAVLRTNGQLAPAAVGKDHQRDARWPAPVEELVHRRADGAPGIEQVIHQQELATGDVEGDFGALWIVLEALLMVIVAIERDVHQTERLAHAKEAMQPLGEPGSAGIKADHGALRRQCCLQLGGELLAELFRLRQLGQSIAPG